MSALVCAVSADKQLAETDADFSLIVSADCVLQPPFH